MRWQRIAQGLIAIFVIGFVVVLATTLRREAAAPVNVTPPPERDNPEAAIENPGGCEQISAAAGRRVFEVKCGRHLMFADGRQQLSEGVELTIDRNDRQYVITSREAEIIPKDDTIEKAVFKGDVRVTSGDSLEVKTGEATYSDTDGIFTIPGPVEFTKGRLRGSGVGATYDRNREVLWLQNQARISVEANPRTGQGAVDGSASQIGVARAEHYVRLTGNAHLAGEGRVIDADELTIHLTDDDERVRTMELRGNSRISGGGAGGPQNMSARDIDLAYGPDGRSLERAHLVEGAVLQLAGGKRISGSTIDLGLAPDGTTVTSLAAARPVEVVLPADGPSPAKRIRSAELTARGAPGAGIQQADFGGGVEYVETRPARAKLPPLDRIARSDRLLVNTQPGFGAVEQADFRGNFTFTEKPDVSAEAPQAIYYSTRDRIELMPGDGLPGPPPRVTDGELAVSARTIAFTMSTREMNAETKVRSTIQPRRKNGNGGGRMPTMLADDKPVNVTANRLAYKGTGSPAVYSGAAMMWQEGETTIKADTITVDDRSGNLRAEGNVTTFFTIDERAQKGKPRTPTPTTGKANVFTFDDEKRLATYTGKAHIVGPQGDVTGERIELFLDPKVNELQRAEAYGPGVVVREGNRMGTGTRLTYTAADDRYLLVGTPVEIIEEKNGTCSRMIGTEATFNRTTAATRMVGSTHFPTEGKTLPSCPAALKR